MVATFGSLHDDLVELFLNVLVRLNSRLILFYSALHLAAPLRELHLQVKILLVSQLQKLYTENVPLIVQSMQCHPKNSNGSTKSFKEHIESKMYTINNTANNNGHFVKNV